MSDKKRSKKQRKNKWTPFVRGKSLTSTGNPNIDTKEVWINSRYQVFVYRVQFKGIPHPMVHLSIKRHSRGTIHDWRDLQRIKQELCGSSCEAVELYPAAIREVDMANQYHLWVLPPGIGFPFGFTDGRLVSTDSGAKQRCSDACTKLGISDDSKQRPFASYHREEMPNVGVLWEDYVKAP